MKLLMLYCSSFSYTTALKSLEEAKSISETKSFENTVVAFVHVEKEDESNEKSIERNLVNNLKWAARKNETKSIILHSFSHLSESKADPEFSEYFLNKIAERINSNTDYTVHQTPWGYFLDLDLKAPGHSLARVFKSF